MQEPITQACYVEQADGVVLVECGNAAVTLTPDAARDLAQKLAEAADETPTGTRPSAGNHDG